VNRPDHSTRERRQIVRHGKGCLDDRVGVAAADIVKGNEPFGSQVTWWDRETTNSTAFSELARRNGGNPVGQRAEAANEPQIRALIRTAGYEPMSVETEVDTRSAD
jgi:hypothetical protein